MIRLNNKYAVNDGIESSPREGHPENPNSPKTWDKFLGGHTTEFHDKLQKGEIGKLIQSN